ncbi:unnamed protein product [Blepharisma stoltei]|uniref:Glucosidase II subunit alpha n=1 Tax=Blepharisma stoltei TaxID=1481888 RepID=A0AAU9JUN8_9CILI|nr:unnamed protein product [Blepharisma stoltei]
MDDRYPFKNWKESSHCQRNRYLASHNANNNTAGLRFDLSYEIISSSILRIDGGIKFTCRSLFEDNPFLQGEIIMYKNECIHVYLDEINPIFPRFRIPSGDILNPQALEKIDFSCIEISERNAIFTWNKAKYEINFSPILIKGYFKGSLTVSANASSLMNFERYRKFTDDIRPKNQEKNQNFPIPTIDSAGIYKEKNGNLEIFQDLWVEKYFGFTDIKYRGPCSVAMDFEFAEATHVYGLAHHADDLPLKDTVNSDPYRFFNFDHYKFHLGEKSALYGASPFIVSRSQKNYSAGVFWMNGSETWIDIKTWDRTKQTHWMSEAGVMEFIMFVNKSPLSIIKKFTMATGPAQLPPLFALAYHQSRWDYNTQSEVLEISSNFDKNDLPHDSIWLDIDTVDSFAYRTWNYQNYPSPIEMLDFLSLNGRKLFVIADPHIKRSFSYDLYRELSEKKFFVNDKNGLEWMGDTWPGNSCWPDLSRPEVRDLWGSYYSFENHKDSTMALLFWNDMNEPAIASGPEKTLSRNSLHNQYEHRELHNLYGLYTQKASYEGVYKRNGKKERPFVLARSFFSGSQRYGATWAGDNLASWGYLDISIPLILQCAVSGLSFTGSDIGGYCFDPSPDLYSRWFQIAAYYPFFRCHSQNESKRREPWLFAEPVLSKIRIAIRERYRLLPYWYTLFYKYSTKGTPVVIPMFAMYPNDDNAADLDRQFMVGSGILVAAITQENQDKVSVYIPEGKWYDYHSYIEVKSGKLLVDTEEYWVPAYIRGGSIITRQEKVRKCSKDMYNDPYSFIVALNDEGKASGSLYIDDTLTFRYLDGEFIYAKIELSEGIFKYEIQKGHIDLNNVVEKIVIIGIKQVPRKIEQENQREIDFQVKGNTVFIYPKAVKIDQSFVIKLAYI